MNKKTTIHMIGQAHLDPVWLWRWTEGKAEALATSKSAVDRLQEYPDFHFVRGESQVYEWIKEEDPRLFDEIRRYVIEGRWHLVNGMIIQPDMNLPQGESLVRHFLLGKQFMLDEFGVEPHIAYCVDSFGHASSLPQIFKKCGMDYYVFMRPGPHEKELPGQAFQWEGPDGSRVIAYRIPGSYGTGGGDHRDHILRALQDKPEALSDSMCFFGVGNHGGGPTKWQIEHIQQLSKSMEGIDIVFSSPQAYFDSIAGKAEELPVVKDELQIHAVGCYSANSLLKQSHRKAECSLLTAERLAAMDNLITGRPYPAAPIDALWHELAFDQFHDIICGSSIKEASNEAIQSFGRVSLGASEIMNRAGRSIGTRVNTSGPGTAFVLFNPFPYPFAGYIEYDPWPEWDASARGGWGVVDELGQAVEFQLVETQDAFSWKDQPGMADFQVSRITFQAKLPPLGYRVFWHATGLPKAESAKGVWVSAGGLENEYLSVKLDPATGVIVSCIDKTSGLELVGKEGWNLGQVLEDTSDTWSHGVRAYDDVVGYFGDAQITIYEDGDLQASLLVERTYGESVWIQQISLRRGEHELNIRNWLDWSGKLQMVKLAFEVPTLEPESVHDIPFGWMKRPCNGAEVPTQMWMDVSGPSAQAPEKTIGLGIINDGKYGCDVKGSQARLTILRCPPYAWHQPHQIWSKKLYDWIDQGLQEFTIVLKPHVGDWRESGIVQRAVEANQPPVPITVHAHPGSLPPSGSLARLDSPEIAMTALKAAQDGRGFIARFADRHGRGGAGTLEWMGQTFPIRVAPFEVITLRLIQVGSSWQAQPCDMIERALVG
jgi:alpha-mannosidase